MTNSYLVTVIDGNFAVFAWYGWKLDPNITAISSAHKDFGACHSKDTSIEAVGPTDHNDWSVKRHLDLNLDFFLTFIFFSLKKDYFPRGRSRPNWKKKTARAKLKTILMLYFKFQPIKRIHWQKVVPSCCDHFQSNFKLELNKTWILF